MVYVRPPSKFIVQAQTELESSPVVIKSKLQLGFFDVPAFSEFIGLLHPPASGHFTTPSMLDLAHAPPTYSCRGIVPLWVPPIHFIIAGRAFRASEGLIDDFLKRPSVVPSSILPDVLAGSLTHQLDLRVQQIARFFLQLFNISSFSLRTVATISFLLELDPTQPLDRNLSTSAILDILSICCGNTLVLPCSAQKLVACAKRGLAHASKSTAGLHPSWKSISALEGILGVPLSAPRLTLAGAEQCSDINADTEASELVLLFANVSKQAFASSERLVAMMIVSMAEYLAKTRTSSNQLFSFSLAVR